MSGLRTAGVRRGDRVLVLAPNTDRFLALAYAVWWLGAVLTPLNVRWSVDELAFALADSGASVLLLDDAFVPLLPALREKSPSMPIVVVIGESGKAPEGAWCYEELLARGEPLTTPTSAAMRRRCCSTPEAPQADRRPAAVARLSSSAPRWPRSPSAASAWGDLPACAADRYVGGLAVVLQAMVGQCTQLMLPVFDPVLFLGLIGANA